MTLVEQSEERLKRNGELLSAAKGKSNRKPIVLLSAVLLASLCVVVIGTCKRDRVNPLVGTWMSEVDVIRDTPYRLILVFKPWGSYHLYATTNFPGSGPTDEEGRYEEKEGKLTLYGKDRSPRTVSILALDRDGLLIKGVTGSPSRYMRQKMRMADLW